MFNCLQRHRRLGNGAVGRAARTSPDASGLLGFFASFKPAAVLDYHAASLIPPDRQPPIALLLDAEKRSFPMDELDGLYYSKLGQSDTIVDGLFGRFGEDVNHRGDSSVKDPEKIYATGKRHEGK